MPSMLMSILLSPSASVGVILLHLPCPLSSNSRGSALLLPLSFAVVVVLFSRLTCGGNVGLVDGMLPSRILFGTLSGFESSTLIGAFKFIFLV